MKKLDMMEIASIRRAYEKTQSYMKTAELTGRSYNTVRTYVNIFCVRRVHICQLAVDLSRLIGKCPASIYA